MVSGNGDSYDGKPKGYYFHFDPILECADQGTSFDELIIEDETAESRSYRCGQLEVQSVDVRSLRYSTHNPQVVNLESLIFDQRLQRPNLSHSIEYVEAICRGTYDNSSRLIDIVLRTTMPVLNCNDKPTSPTYAEIVLKNNQSGVVERISQINVDRIDDIGSRKYLGDLDKDSNYDDAEDFRLSVFSSTEPNPQGIQRGYLKIKLNNQKYVVEDLECNLSGDRPPLCREMND